ncbi:MAG: type IV pili methyl-accepting chemotaxis transducer N-terminal domain-containing protein [bacterium]
MKYIYAITAAFLLSSTQVSLANEDISQQLKAQTKTAFEAIHKEMAVKINLSGKQRMLTQKMSKESLLISQDIDKEENLKNLEASMRLFEQTLIGLRNGDESLELSKTDNDKILAQLDIVDGKWATFKPLIESVIAGKADKSTLEKIAELNLPLLAEMNKAVSLYEVNAGADVSELAITINLSGKQRMLTQKMTKELLLIANDINKEDNLKNLEKTVNLFEKTLVGLEKGDGDLYLAATTDEAILKQLATIKTQWDSFKPIVESAETSKENLQQAAELNLPLLKEMNKAVKMYEQLSES